jgi:hypothetical protein
MCPFFKPFAKTLRATPPEGSVGSAPRVSTSSAEITNQRSYASFPTYAFMEWCVIVRRGNFTVCRQLVPDA